jgi:hypothetical protein
MALRERLTRHAGEDGMTCQEAIALLVDHLEATLDDEQLARLEQHLAGGDLCVAYLRTYGSTRDVVAADGSHRASSRECLEAHRHRFYDTCEWLGGSSLSSFANVPG